MTALPARDRDAPPAARYAVSYRPIERSTASPAGLHVLELNMAAGTMKVYHSAASTALAPVVGDKRCVDGAVADGKPRAPRQILVRLPSAPSPHLSCRYCP